MSTLKEEREAIVEMIAFVEVDGVGVSLFKNDTSIMLNVSGSKEYTQSIPLLLSHEEKVMERVLMSVGGINFRRQIKGAFEDYAHAHPEVQQFNSDVRRGIEKRLHANIRTLVLSKLTK